jgi:hypothetical protein
MCFNYTNGHIIVNTTLIFELEQMGEEFLYCIDLF